jgi:hypothetical protein
VPGVDEHDAAVGQPFVEKLDVGGRNRRVVAAVDERHRGRDLRQQLRQHGQLLRVCADVTGRLGEPVAVVRGEVVGADLVGHAGRDPVHHLVDDRPRVHPTVLVEVGVEHP